MKKNLLLWSMILSYVFINNTFGQQGPSQIITGQLIRVTPKLSDIKVVPLDTKTTPSPNDEKAMEFRQKVNKKRQTIDNPKAISTDKSIQNSISPKMLNREPRALIQSFNGAGATDNAAVGFGTLVPPDPAVSVGPNHVVQMINLVHKVYDKSGNLLTGPLKFSSIASTSTDDGDPITLYDHMADRWILLQFSKLFTNGQESLIFCVSQTGDPTGAYNVYEFRTTGVFPDYPHVGIWNNTYIVTTHNFNTAGEVYLGQGYWAFDRSKMIAGVPTTTAIGFNDPSTFAYLPVSAEGAKTPEPNSLPTFVTYDADEFPGGTDRLQIRTLTPNFTNPASSVLSAAIDLPTNSFDARQNGIEQVGTPAALDALGDRMMSRITYRRFDNYESMVMNYIVNVSGVNPTTVANYKAAPRWYELTRANPTDPWTINQQSSYAPVPVTGTADINRWMSCPGIDQRGNIALGYSRSSSVDEPDIYYAERKKSDPLNTLGAEQVFHLSGGVQTDGSGRWGDYSAMTTDPVDEETMWFTAEYYAATSSRGFSTRIGSFKVNDPITTQTVRFQKSGTITRQVESTTPSTGPPNFPYKDYPITVMIDNAPSQPVNLTLIKTGTATEGVDYDILNASALVLNGTTLSQTMTLRVYDDGLVNEANEYVDLSYTINANGGNAVAGTFNQKHRITIVGTPICPSAVAVSITRPTTFCEGDSVILNGNTNPNYSYQWFRNGTLISGATQAQYIAKTSGIYNIEFTQTGCTLPSMPITVIAKVGAPVPATVNRSVPFGTVITAGNGLQANASCPGTSTQTYSGATVGYDNNLISGVNPTVTFAGLSPNLGKVRISVTWRKKSGGNQTTCGDAGGTANPFNQEVSFRIKGPNNVTLNLLNSATYVNGGSPAGVVTTVFEDGGAAIGTVPASGTFNPAQSLAGFAGIDPNGTWTIIPNDNGAGDPLCVQGFAVTVTTPGTGAASSITWHDAATGGTQVGTGTEFIPSNTAVGTYTYYAQAMCSGLTDCANSIRKATTLTITPAACNTVAGAVTADATVCSGLNSGTLTLSGHTGSILRWESSTDNFVTSTVISNTTTTQTYSNLTQTTKYRAVVQDGTCTQANSTPATITVTNSTVAGAVTADATVCTGSNSGTLTLAGHTGSILRWESSIDNFVTIVTIANTTTTQTYTNLTQTTKYRAVVQNGTCTVANSAPATITVSNGTVAGAVTADASVCTGSNSGTLTLAGYTGSILRWESSIDNFVTIVTIANTTTTQTYTNLTQTTKYHAVVQNGTCTEANSTPATITVTNGTVAGAVTADATVCTGSNSGTLTLAGHTGSILRWESSIDNFATIVTIANITTTQAYLNIAQTTKYRAVVQNGTCTEANSSPATITVLAPATPVATGATMTLGDPPVTLTATNCTGAGLVLKWYQTVDNASVTMPVAPPATTQYYARCEQTVGATVCLSPKSNDVTLTVNVPSGSVIVYVNIANIAAPIQNGNTWGTAYGNLQTALSAAPAGSEIWVAQGTYKPTNTSTKTISFNIPSGGVVYGGFVGTEVSLNQRNFTTNQTILSGEIGSPAITTDNSYHVVVFDGANNTTRLDGFTVTSGNANYTASAYNGFPSSAVLPVTVNDGGGIALDNGSSPMIANCRIINNRAIIGAGLFATNGSMPTIMNCFFMGNESTFGGGAYHLGSNAVYKNVLFAGNKATGGAVYNNGSSPTFTNVTMAGNGGNNGGIFNSVSSPVVKNSIIWGNIGPFNDTQSIITYSIVEGGYSGMGNLNLDPQLVSLTPNGLSPNTSGDYKLTNTSPAIDAGDNGSISLTDKDLVGSLRRYNGGIVDIGAYEFQGSRMGGNVTSITSGNWEMGTTWNIGRKPLAGDNVIINNNHIVTVNQDGVLKNLEIRQNAKILYGTVGIKLQTGF
jgi:Ig-like domain CHU_C associated